MSNFLIAQLEKDINQLPMNSVPDKSWDVAIVGSGPAGAIAAVHLTSKGHSVLLLDKKQFPREKVCGDGLISDSLRCLKRAGIYKQVCELGYESSQGVVYSPSRIEMNVTGQFVTLKRFVLDTLIVRKASKCGAVIAHGNVKDISIQSNGNVTYRVEGLSRPVSALVGMVATGAKVSLLKRLNMVSQDNPTAIAMRCYLKSSAQLDKLVISYDKSIIPGYAWIFPLGNGEYNMGCGVPYTGARNYYRNLSEMFNCFIREFPIAKKLMENRKNQTKMKAHTLRCGLEGTDPRGKGNLLAVGETIGTTFPFTGEGIGKAMESGELAAKVTNEALKTGNFDTLKQYDKLLETELRPRYVGYKIAERWLSKAWLNDFVARRSQNSNFIQGALEGIINETIDPRTVFSIKGILKSFWC